MKFWYQNWSKKKTDYGVKVKKCSTATMLWNSISSQNFTVVPRVVMDNGSLRSDKMKWWMRRLILKACRSRKSWSKTTVGVSIFQPPTMFIKKSRFPFQKFSKKLQHTYINAGYGSWCNFLDLVRISDKILMIRLCTSFRLQAEHQS